MNPTRVKTHQHAMRAAIGGIGLLALATALPLQAQTLDAQPSAVAQPVVARSASSAESMGAPLSAPTTASADYKITANDLMEFDVFGVPDMKRDVRVNASGEIALPLIGQVPVAGLTAQAAEDRIAAKYKEKYLQDPQVSLFIKEFTTQRVAIEGAVTRPGIYPMSGQLTLLRALALSGGFAPYADLQQIVVYRNNAGGVREQTTYDLDKVRAGTVPDPSIRSDDVIVVQRNAKRTALRDSLFRDVLDTLNPFK